MTRAERDLLLLIAASVKLLLDEQGLNPEPISDGMLAVFSQARQAGQNPSINGMSEGDL